MHALILSLVLFTQDPLAEDIDQSIGALYSDRGAESDHARQELAEIGRRAVPKLVAELTKQRDHSDKQKQVRVRRLICEILGRIRDNSQPVLDALTARLQDTDEYGLSVAAAAAGALGMIADERTVGALVTALTSKQAETDKWLKYYCIHGVGVMRGSQATEALKKALEDPGATQLGDADDRLIAAAAADALGRIRAKDAVEGLGKLLSNDKVNPYTQQSVGLHAAQALERITGESRGPLQGDQTTVTASLASWRSWWDGEQGKRHAETTRGRIADIATAIEAFKKDHGKLPDTLTHLKEKPAGLTGNWPEGGYYKGEGWERPSIKDAWGRAFVYDPQGKNGAPYDVYSLGRDGQPWGKGDGADIWNHDGWKAARAEASRKAMDEILAALKKFNEDQGVWPDQLLHLQGDKPPVGFTVKKEWPKEGYIKSVPRDGYDRAFEYRKPGTGGEPYDLISFGSDGAAGGTDAAADLWNHDKWKGAKADEAKKKLDAVAKAVDTFRKEQDRWPAKLTDLRDKPGYAKKWPDKGYWKGEAGDPSVDSFGNPFEYKTTADTAEIGTLGADGKQGGTGPDEDVWQKRQK